VAEVSRRLACAPPKPTLNTKLGDFITEMTCNLNVLFDSLHGLKWQAVDCNLRIVHGVAPLVTVGIQVV
jgi:hypothetical protein